MNASVSEIVNFGDVQQLLSSSDIHATGNRLRQLLAPPGFVQQLVLRLLPMAASVLPTELQALWTLNCLPAEFLEHLHLHEAPDTTVNSTFRLGLGAQIAVGLAGLSAAYLHYLREGETQDVSVDARHAVLSFHSEAWYTINDSPPPGDLWDSVAGLYKTKDNRWVRIHTNFPHHRRGVLEILGIHETDKELATKSDVAAAILKWNAIDFEDTCAERGMCVTALRTYEEWKEHPQAIALRDVPPVEIRKVAESPPPATKKNAKRTKRPLQGINVLDLSRVLAGPVAGRTLAAHGADVLLVTSPNLPSLPLVDMETSLGKHTTQLDLLEPADIENFRHLAQEADVLLQAYRPGGIEEKGFGVSDMIALAEERQRGVVCANLRAWGWEGPWQGRRGFDSLVQTATGFNADEGQAYQVYMGSTGTSSNTNPNGWSPKPLPMQALDHAAGYFLAFGVNAALCKMIEEGGSYEVRVSLAAVGQWIRSLGRISAQEAFREGKPLPKREDQEITKLRLEWNERMGQDKGDNWERRRMAALRHAAVLSRTPVREGILQTDESLEGEESDWGAPIILDADDVGSVYAAWHQRSSHEQ